MLTDETDHTNHVVHSTKELAWGIIMASSSTSTQKLFTPPANFGLIEPGVYRSAFPNPDSFSHLQLLGLRAVINLSREALTRAATVFLVENGILLADVGLQVWTHPQCEPVSHELIKEAMRFVLDQAYHPILVVSASGTHQVGAFVGCLRRLQHWTLAATLAEYRLYAAPSPRIAVEHFIELWDCDLLTLPANLPAWFEHQQALLEEDRALLKGQGAVDLLPGDPNEVAGGERVEDELIAASPSLSATGASVGPTLTSYYFAVDRLALPGTKTTVIGRDD